MFSYIFKWKYHCINTKGCYYDVKYIQFLNTENKRKRFKLTANKAMKLYISMHEEGGGVFSHRWLPKWQLPKCALRLGKAERKIPLGNCRVEKYLTSFFCTTIVAKIFEFIIFIDIYYIVRTLWIYINFERFLDGKKFSEKNNQIFRKK